MTSSKRLLLHSMLICLFLTLTSSQLTPLNIDIQIIDSPDPVAQNFPQKAKDLITAWDPFMIWFLNSDGFTPFRFIQVIFQKGLQYPAATSQDKIYVSVDHINTFPNDYGMMIHMYTYVVQRYPANKYGIDGGWLTGGIADYMRYIYYAANPDNPTNPTPSTSFFVNNEPVPTDTYKSGFGNAARFLFWISQRYGIANLVPQLNRVMRKGIYQPSIFVSLTSKTVDELWNDYVTELGVTDLKVPTSDLPPLEIAIQIIDNPDRAQDYPQITKDLVIAWDPFIARLLSTDGFIPSRSVTFSFQKNIGPPAYAMGDTITVNVDHINNVPTDFGMMIHEYTHVVQQYPGNKFGEDAGWLTEGIADYVRYICYETNPNNPNNPTPSDNFFTKNEPIPTNTYKSGYGNAARFLFWISERYGIVDLVPQLNRVMREGTYQPSIFVDLTSKTTDELWNAYMAEF